MLAFLYTQNRVGGKIPSTLKIIEPKLIKMSDAEYQSQQYAKWPLEGRSFADTALWLNGELMKNVAEIGYGRFLYAACKK